MQNTSSAHLSVLSAILDRQKLSADPRLLCSAARVCSTWQTAVVASGAATDVLFIYDMTPSDSRFPGQHEHLEKLCSFAAWLRKYGHLVRSTTLEGFAPLPEPVATTACQMLVMAMQLAAAGPRPLRLERFATDVRWPSSCRALLAALPESVIEMQLEAAAASHAREALDAALVRLKQLRKLSMSQELREFGGNIHLHLPALRMLSCLTCLELNAIVCNDNVAPIMEAVLELPALQQLSLDLDPFPASPQHAPLKLRGMTSLTKLHLCLSDFGFSRAEVPAKLQDLSLHLGRLPPGCNPVTDMQLKELSDLRCLRLQCHYEPLTSLVDSVAEIRQLTQLQSLELSCNSVPTAVHDRNEWPKLPKITALRISDEFKEMWDDHRGKEQLYLPMVQQLSGLTRLELRLVCHWEIDQPVFVCEYLSGLVDLRHLSLYCSGDTPHAEDCLQLWRLSQLTHLTLHGMRLAVDDTVAVALGSNMPQLRHLDLTNCGVETQTALPALAGLRHLTQLVLTGNECCAQRKTLLIKQLRDPRWPSLAIKR